MGHRTSSARAATASPSPHRTNSRHTAANTTPHRCSKYATKHTTNTSSNTPTTTAYLLDAVRNSFEFQELCDYDELAALAESLGVPVKERVTVLGDEDAARAFVADIIRDDYTYRGEHIEGFVFAGADGHMLKYKTPYYRQWKGIRALLESSKPVNRERCNELERSVLDWVAEQGIEFRAGRAWPEDADARIDDAPATDASDAKAFDSDGLIRLRNAYQAAQGMPAGRNQ